MTRVEHHLVATHDPPPKGIPNPIHDDDGADGAGYSGALVAGVRTYGWAAEAIIEALGEGWLADGWVDFTLRRPLYTGDEVTIAVTPAEPGEAGDGWSVEVTARDGADERLVLDGTCGRGDAPFVGDVGPPVSRPGEEPPAVRPTYDIDTVPLGQPLRPLAAHVSVGAAQRLASDDLGLDAARYLDAERPVVHPYFVAGRMAPLTRHNFTYGPTIHVRSQIQHRALARGGQDITITAEIVDAYDRKDHWYQVLDGVVTGSETGEIAVLRHHTIFRPRGTTMPPPIGSAAG